MSAQQISGRLRDEIRARAGGRCEYCRVPDELQVGTFHCDHCIPERAGGRTDKDNLAWACPRCNGSKLAATHGIDSLTTREERLFNPRVDVWNDHFEIALDQGTILGKTPVGRATVARLGFNRDRPLAVRRRLIELKQFP